MAEVRHGTVARGPKRPRLDTQNCINEQYSAANYGSLHGIESDHSRSQQAQDYEWDDIYGCSDDENHGKTKTTGRRDAKKHQDSSLDNNHGINSKVDGPTPPDRPATKNPRLGSVMTEPSRSAGGNRDLVLKKVQFDADNSEPTGPVPGAKRTGTLGELTKSDRLSLSKGEYRGRPTEGSIEENTSGNNDGVRKMQFDMDTINRYIKELELDPDKIGQTWPLPRPRPRWDPKELKKQLKLTRLFLSMVEFREPRAPGDDDDEEGEARNDQWWDNY